MDFWCVHLFPIPQCLRPKCLLSRFPPRTIHNRGIFLARLSCRTDAVATSLWQKKGEIRPSNQTELLVLWMVRRIASCNVFPIRQEILYVSKIPVTLRGIRPPSFIQTWLQQYSRSPCVTLSQQYHLFLNGELWTYNDSRINLHRLCQILRNCLCEWLLVSSSAPRTFVSSFLFPEKFWFCTDKVEFIEMQNFVPLQRVDDCFEIRILHEGLCDLLSSTHQKFLPEVRLCQCVFCKEPLFSWSSCRCRIFGPSGSEKKHSACPIPLFLAALKLIHEKNSRVRPCELEHFHPKDSR